MRNRSRTILIHDADYAEVRKLRNQTARCLGQYRALCRRVGYCYLKHPDLPTLRGKLAVLDRMLLNFDDVPPALTAHEQLDRLKAFVPLLKQLTPPAL